MTKVNALMTTFAGLTLSYLGYAQNGIDSIISMQQFDAGKFNIICADGSKSSVTKADVLEDNVCNQVTIPVPLNNGLFTSQNLNCPQRVVSLTENNVLKSVDLTWTCSGVTNRFVCDEAQPVCSVTYQGTLVSITVLSSNTYTYKGLDGNNYDFAWSSSKDSRVTSAAANDLGADGTSKQ